jgi:hypothetical protein
MVQPTLQIASNLSIGSSKRRILESLAFIVWKCEGWMKLSSIVEKLGKGCMRALSFLSLGETMFPSTCQTSLSFKCKGQ